MKITGVDRVIHNLNREIKKIEGANLRGLIRAAALVREDMDKTQPLIPVDTGNLRASWTVRPIKQGEVAAVECGFTANYALFVHEMMGTRGQTINWSRPGSGPKFFQAALFRNRDRILEIIRQEAEIPK